jgi:cytosine/adenosine deaminase-related metal-dependent hydrolase
MQRNERPASWTLTARWLVPVDAPPLAGGTITVAGDRILAVEPHGDRTAHADAGDCAILPGFVNAHTHLDLSGLRGRVPPTTDFTDWLRAVIRHRRESDSAHQEVAIRAGIAESVACGTTLLGDIAGLGASWPLLKEAPLRSVVFYELLGLTRQRARQAWRAGRAWLAEHPATPFCRPGLSPHAPYSVRASLIRLVARLACEQSFPLALHLAESQAELELLARRQGSFVPFLTALGVWDPKGLARSPEHVIQLCTRAPRTLFAHANYLASQTQVPRESTLIYCPRTHAAFGHQAYPLLEFVRAGTRIALGTDGLASNPDLSVLEEARFVYRRYPQVDAEAILRMATLNGAEALGWSEVTGSLTPGKSADLVVLPLASANGDDPYPLILESSSSVRAVLWRGRWSFVDASLPWSTVGADRTLSGQSGESSLT